MTETPLVLNGEQPLDDLLETPGELLRHAARPARWDAERTAVRGERARSAVGAYPNPWFDLSSTYIPSSYKELFRWCQYLYTSHSEIAPIVNKKCSYVITRIIYDTTQEHAKKLWKEVLEKICAIRRMEFMLLLDLEVYGNAFASIYYPFERYLECPACKAKQEARRRPWTYVDFKFVSECDKCGRKGAMKATDKTIHSRTRTRVLRWNPQYVAIRHNPLTDKREYVYQIPKWVRQRVQNKNINRVLVEDTPLEFLDAIKKRKNVLFSPTNIYHFHNPAPSGEDDAFGMPPMMPIFKDAWLFQVYKRAQEAVAMEHVLPLTILVPQPVPGASPHANTNLAEWSRKMMEVVALWRRDQNSIYTAPFPLTVQNIRGDAQALSVHNELNMVRQEIAGGLDVPQEFIDGRERCCQRIDVGLVTTSRGLLTLGELSDEAAAESVDAGVVQIPGWSSQPGSLALAARTGKNEVLRLKTELGQELYPTAGHRFLTLDPESLGGKWVAARDLRRNDYIGVRVGANLWGPGEGFPPSPVVGKRTKPVKTPSIADEDFGALAGLMVAEGSLTDASNPCASMANRALMEQACEIASRVFGYPVPLRINQSENRFGNTPMHVISFERKIAADFLREHIGCAYSETRFIPRAIRTAPRGVVVRFLQWLFEGDGGVSTRDVFYCSTSSRLVSELQAFLMNIGIISHIYRRPPTDDRLPMFDLRILGDEVTRFASEVGFIGEGKQAKLGDLVLNRLAMSRETVRSRLPFVTERLKRFVAEHRIGKLWETVHETPSLQRAEYTIHQLAEEFGKDDSTVRLWVKNGLKAKASSTGYTILAQDFRDYVAKTGLRQRVRITVPQYGAIKSDLQRVDLAFVRRHEPELAENLQALADPNLIWVAVREIAPHASVETGDLTVDEAGSYLMNGAVTHHRQLS